MGIISDGKEWLQLFAEDGGGGGDQLHLREGQTRTINNSLTFDLKSADINDRRAKFEIFTSMTELDNCETLVLLGDKGCEYRYVRGWDPIDVNIYEVLKYLKNPENYTDWYFKPMHGGHYHEYGAEGAVMRMRRASNGALEGPIEMGSRNGDEYHRFWIRFELVP